MTDDLTKRLRDCADELRNTWNNESGETPELVYLWEVDTEGDPYDSDIVHTYTPDRPPNTCAAGIDLRVASDIDMAHIPPYEGEQMVSTAHAIVDAGVLLRVAADTIDEMGPQPESRWDKVGPPTKTGDYWIRMVDPSDPGGWPTVMLAIVRMQGSRLMILNGWGWVDLRTVEGITHHQHLRTPRATTGEEGLPDE